MDRRKLSLIAIINTKHESVGCRVSKSIALIKHIFNYGLMSWRDLERFNHTVDVLPQRWYTLDWIRTFPIILC